MAFSIREEVNTVSVPSTANDLDDAVVQTVTHKSFTDYLFFQADSAIDHEQSQALTRIVLTGLVTLVMIGIALQRDAGPQATLNALLGLGYLAFSAGYYLWVSRSKGRHLWRRYLVILGDLGITAYVNYIHGLAGLGIYPVFLWIMIGNGLRFGTRYLHAATAVGLVGFGFANHFNGTLEAQPVVSIGLFVGLLLMPKFFLVMVHRLSEANQALKGKIAEAHYMATHDILTGLPNRALLKDRIQQAIAKTARSGNHCAVVFLDLNGFKAINDEFGHAHGDELLVKVARSLRGGIRAGNSVARLGGDEFVVLVEDVKNSAEVAAVVEQLLTCTSEPYAIGNYRTAVHWSTGVAVYPRDGADPETLLHNADTAMYRAKQQGSKYVQLYDAKMSDQVEAQLALRDEIRHALSKGGFQTFFQPQISLPGEKIVGAEALLRWPHPEHGMLLPDRFLPAAEKSGLMLAIGEEVLRRTAQVAAILRQNRRWAFPLYVNLSERQIGASAFPGLWKTVLKEFNLPKEAIGIEVPESFIAEADDRTFRQLRAIGAMVSVDHFGTGYSSLANLGRLPVTRVKIDRSLIQGLPQNTNSKKLVKAAIATAKALHLEVVGEGVERRIQAEWLAVHGCRVIQGDYFGRPMEFEDFKDYVQEFSRGSLRSA